MCEFLFDLGSTLLCFRMWSMQHAHMSHRQHFYVSGHDSLACTAALEKHRGLRVFQGKKLTSRAWAWVVGGKGFI